MDKDNVKIKIPNTRFWILGERKKNNKWNLYLTEPGTTRKEIIKENITTNAFAIFSNMTLKTPFPFDK